MPKRETGRYEATSAGGELVQAFVPNPLPPMSPPVLVQGRLVEQVRATEQALARLDLAGEMVPSLDWFIYAFVRKEAVLSSQIEGTQATLLDLLSFEADDGPLPANGDVEEVCNYLDAMTYARGQLADPAGLPLSMRLLNQTHQLLLRGARGATKGPGEVRRSQNWVGGGRPGHAVYVPPPPHLLPNALSDLERYIHAHDDLPAIIRAGLLHVQFETIHPYLDGNGRIGRLLIGLLLEHWKLLTRPTLYLSLYFKRHRHEYYRRLNAVRTDGDWEGWLEFFLDGVTTIANEAVVTARDLFALVTADRQQLHHNSHTNLLAVQLFEQLPSRPLVTVTWIVQAFETTKPTAGRAIEALVASGILVETTGKQRDRVYAYQGYLDRLRTGTELVGEG
jgi:Fic family protein